MLSLSDLTRFDQWGGPSGSAGDRVRLFAYDSLSRLIASANPEKYSAMTPPQLSCVSGSSTLYSECFAYDANSNLSQHTDNRNITTTLLYDVLNRLVQKTYSDGTPTAFFQFDTPVANISKTMPTMPPLTINQTNLIGRLSVEGTVLTSGTGYSYDEQGRTTISATCSPRTCGQIPSHTILDQYNLNYTYDLAGRPIFASRGTLAQRNTSSPDAGYYYGGMNLQYQGAGQVQNATSDLPTGSGQPTQNIATSILYSPLGGISGVGIGGEFSQTSTYAPRGWLSMRSFSDLQANATTTEMSYHGNVGNVSMNSDTFLGQYDYCYDQLNRLRRRASMRRAWWDGAFDGASGRVGCDVQRTEVRLADRTSRRRRPDQGDPSRERDGRAERDGALRSGLDQRQRSG